MLYSRRNLLKSTGAVGMSTLVASKSELLTATAKYPLEAVDRKQIVDAAIEAAVSSGATYADARLTHIGNLRISGLSHTRSENMAFGIRALYQGYWGFAASPVWSNEEAVRLGQAAVAQAKANVLGRERITQLAPLEITNGHWEMPIKDDPFSMHLDEIIDFGNGLSSYAISLKFMRTFFHIFEFSRTNKIFGSSLGQYTTQTLYQSSANMGIRVSDSTEEADGIIEEISPAGLGFEYFRDRPLREYVRICHEEAVQDLKLPRKPIDPGRYNVLIDQSGVGSLLNQSIGSATEIDRVFGFEANSGGTSYITEPETMLNSFKIGSSLLNVFCDRSEPGSVGRVKWDDEGVEPVRYDLVKGGTLINLQTNREGASWIKDHFQSTGQPLKSFGSANAPSALDAQIVHKADMYLRPDQSTLTRDDLREDIDEGIELRIPAVSMDFQQVTGWARGGRAYEISKGKRISRLGNAGMLFRTSELWSNMIRLGGQDSVRYYGLKSSKGQPNQTIASGVYVPPVLFKEMTFIDIKRKA